MPDLDEQQVDKLEIERYADQDFEERVGDAWKVLFNPSELSLTRSNRFNQQPTSGTSRPQTSYEAGNADQLSLTLLFDGTGVVASTATVRQRVNEFLALMRYEGEEHRPHYLRLRWGELSFQCFLKSATVTFTLFDRHGEPLRARVNAAFEEVMPPTERERRERRASPDLFQVWTVEEGDTLDDIAHRVYGSVDWWRSLAEANDLPTASALVPGQVLTLPAVRG